MKLKNLPRWLRRLALGALLLALLGALAWVALRSGPLAPIKVTLTRVSQGSLSPAIFGIGTVEARRSFVLSPTAPGRVLALRADVGESVKAGQVLAEMEPVDLDQRLSALEASLARALSVQTAAQAQLNDATARHTLAKANTQRNQDLAHKNFISPGALDARVQEQASAEATQQAALANLNGAGQELRRLHAERAGLVQQRGHLRLLAPSDGVVTARDAEPGNTVVAGQPVLRLIDPSSLWVRLRVDQGRSAGLVNGLPARIVLRSQSANTLSGQVARVELLADPVTEERVAQVTFTQLPTGVSVGEMAEVTLQLPVTAASLLLPNASIQRWQGQTGVWRLKEGRPEFAPVQLGAHSLEGQVQVLHGLTQGDEVVVFSLKALTPGARIQVVPSLLAPEAAP